MRSSLGRLKKVIPATLVYLLAVLIPLFARYIDHTVIFKLYLPILLFGLGLAMLKMHVFTNVFFLFAGVGLLIEYFLHLENKLGPSLSGGLTNLALLFLGLLLGALLQYLTNKKKKEDKEKGR